MTKVLFVSLLLASILSVSIPCFAEKIRIVAYSWTCPSCEASNSGSATHCRICGRSK